MKRRPPLPTSQVWTIVITTACILALLIHPGIPAGDEFWAFALLAALIIITPYASSGHVDDGAAEVDSAMIFVFAGAMLLPPILFVLLALVPTFAAWPGIFSLPSRKLGDDRTIPVSTSVRVFSGLLAGILISFLHPSDVWGWMMSLVLSGLVFLVPGWLVPVLAHIRGPKPGEMYLAPPGRRGLIRDCFLVILGAALAVLWKANAWLVIPALLQSLLIYRVSQVPRLERQAQTDAKTGLWNARHLEILFKTELERATRFERPLSLLMADLDLMRNINNRHGHLAGDGVLRGIGDIIRRSLREYDIAARFGGEEFVIVLPETRQEEAALIAERIRSAVSTEEYGAGPGRPPIHATMSIGIGSFPSDATTAADLMRAADRALYSAKAAGRDRVMLASQAPERSPTLGPITEQAAPIKVTPMAALFTLLRPPLLFLGRASTGEAKFARNVALLTVLLLSGLVSGSTLFIAAQQALPGDSLYSFKLAGENLKLALTGDEANKAALQLSMATERFEELKTLVESGSYGQVAAAALAYSQDIESATQSLALLQVRDPASAEALASRAELEWTEAKAFMAGLSGHAPMEIQSPIALVLAVLQSQMAMLQANMAAISGTVPALEGLALPTPEPVQSPIIAPAPAPPSVAPKLVRGGDGQSRAAIAEATPRSPTPAGQAVLLSSQNGHTGAFDVSKSARAKSRTPTSVSHSASAAAPVTPAPKPSPVKPVPHKKPSPHCGDKPHCPRSTAPQAALESDTVSVADWRQWLAGPK